MSNKKSGNVSIVNHGNLLYLIQTTRNHLYELCFSNEQFNEKLDKNHFVQLDQIKENLVYISNNLEPLNDGKDKSDFKDVYKQIGQSIYYFGKIVEREENVLPYNRITSILNNIFEQLNASNFVSLKEIPQIKILNYFLLESLNYNDIYAFKVLNECFKDYKKYDNKSKYLVFVSFYAYSIIENKPYWLNQSEMDELYNCYSFLWCSELDNDFDFMWFATLLDFLRDAYDSIDETLWLETFRTPNKPRENIGNCFDFNKLGLYWLLSLLINCSDDKTNRFNDVYNLLTDNSKDIVYNNFIDLSIHTQYFDSFFQIYQSFGGLKTKTKAVPNPILKSFQKVQKTLSIDGKSMLNKALKNIPIDKIVEGINKEIATHEGFQNDLNNNKRYANLLKMEVTLSDQVIYDDDKIMNIASIGAPQIISEALHYIFLYDKLPYYKKVVGSFDDFNDEDFTDILSIKPDYKWFGFYMPFYDNTKSKNPESKPDKILQLPDAPFEFMINDTCLFFRKGAIQYNIEILPEYCTIRTLTEGEINAKIGQFRKSGTDKYSFFDDDELDEETLKRRIYTTYFNLTLAGSFQVDTNFDLIRAYLVKNVA